MHWQHILSIRGYLLFVDLEFRSWEKFNSKPTRNAKNPWWFALSNRIIEDDEIQKMSDAEFRAYVYLLCLASQKNQARITVNLEKACRITGIKKDVFLNCITILIDCKICTRFAQTLDVICANSVATLQDKTLHNSAAVSAKHANQKLLESIYEQYPKRNGSSKSKGLALLDKQIKSQEDFDACLAAVHNYAMSRNAEIAKNKDNEQYTKLFQTWCGPLKDPEWRNWVTLDVPVKITQHPYKVSF